MDCISQVEHPYAKKLLNSIVEFDDRGIISREEEERRIWEKAALTLTHREYLAVAIPLLISTETQPLLGAVDTAVIGMMGDAPAIAGVSLGANLFNTPVLALWLFESQHHRPQRPGSGYRG